MTKVIFFGTSNFAVSILEKLAVSEKLYALSFKLSAIVTNPDKPAGRKNELTAPPVKLAALKLRLSPIWQPEKLKDPAFLEQLQNTKPDVIVLAAYGKIIPPELLSIPVKGWLNVHPSLLPQFRGATPIQSAILEGLTETGVSIVLMDEQIDHGPIIAQEKLHIKPDDTYLTLEQKLSYLGAELLEKNLPDWVAGRIKPQEQNHNKATLCKKITKEDGKINWSKPAIEIERQIRAFIQWPGSYTSYSKLRGAFSRREGAPLTPPVEQLKITKAAVLNGDFSRKPGLVQKLHSSEVLVTCGSGALQLKKVHPAGGNVMDIDAFVRGRPEFIGQILQ